MKFYMLISMKISANSAFFEAKESLECLLVNVNIRSAYQYCENHKCTVYALYIYIYTHKIAQRGDTDVTNLNRCIERLFEFWQKHDMHCINNTHSYFKGSNRLPIQRFFSKDGIHLTHSGVERLLNAINNISIIEDYDLSVFNGPKPRRSSVRRSGSSEQGQFQRKSNLK